MDFCLCDLISEINKISAFFFIEICIIILSKIAFYRNNKHDFYTN